MLSVLTFFISYDSVLKVLCINRDSYLQEIANVIVVSSSGCLDGFQLAQGRVILCLLVAAQQLSSRLVTQNLNMFLDWNEGSHFNHRISQSVSIHHSSSVRRRISSQFGVQPNLTFRY